MKPHLLAPLRWTPLLALGAALAASPAPAVDVLSVPAGGLVSGQALRLRLPPLPAGADEMEVYLSIDGGATFPVRLSEERDPAPEVEVRVPDLPTGAARLLVRAGGRDASGRFERDLAVSGTFGIRRGGASLLVPWADRGRLARRGDRARVEWRAEERSALAPVPFEPAAPASTSPRGARSLFPAGLEAVLSGGRDPLPVPVTDLLAEGRGGERVTRPRPGGPAGAGRSALPGPLRL